MNSYDRIVESLSDLSSDELNKLENEIGEMIVSKQEEEENINILFSSLEDYFNKGLTLTLYPVDWGSRCFEERTLRSLDETQDVLMFNKSWSEEEDN